ncbi:MAG: 50S ribosomal protein L29 [Candidatus Aquicultorales bacterium]
MAKVDEYRDLNEDELLDRFKAAKEELFNLRFQLATGQLDNPMAIKEIRKRIARIQTVLREKEIAAGKAAAS